jgi:hypothetical protein
MTPLEVLGNAEAGADPCQIVGGFELDLEAVLLEVGGIGFTAAAAWFLYITALIVAAKAGSGIALSAARTARR